MSGGGSKISTGDQRIAAMEIQKSSYGLPIPIVYGTTRVSPNMLWYGDYDAIAHTSQQSSGGKGGGGATTENTTYNYQAALILGLCEGNIAAIGQVWKSKALTTLADIGMTAVAGTSGQAPWSYLTTLHPDQADGYSGIAYVAASGYPLTSSAGLDNHTFEIISGTRALLNPGPSQSYSSDAHPYDIVLDMLTNPEHGAGFDNARLGSWTDFLNYTAATGLFFSPCLDQQRPAQEWIKEILAAANCAPVWSEGVLKIVPYGDANVSGNGYSYTANTTPVYDLTDDDFIVQGAEDPVICTRKRQSDSYNQLQLEYLDRANQYNISIAEAKDQAAIDRYGLRPMASMEAHFICDAAVAQLVVQLVLQRQLYIRNQYEFHLSWNKARLEPMDIVTLTDIGLGLNLTPVRIVSIEEDEFGQLKVIAEDYPFGIASATLYPNQQVAGFAHNYTIAPGNVTPPVIFEPPIELTSTPQQGLEIWVAVSGGENWGGCDVWLSTDGDTYKQQQRIHGGARYGALTAALPAAAVGLDSINTLSVSLLGQGGQLLSGSDADRDQFNTLCYAGGEFVSYKTAVLAGQNAYNLSSLQRGAFASPHGAHPSGSAFVRCDQAVAKIAIDPTLYLGKTIYIKFLSFNIYSSGEQSLADVEPYTYTPTGVFALAPPADVPWFTIENNKLSWGSVTDLNVTGYLLRYHQGINRSWNDAINLADGLITANPYTMQIVPSGQITLMVKAVNSNGVVSVNPAVIITDLGDPLVDNVVVTTDFAVLSWPGTLTGGTDIAGVLTATSLSLMWNPNDMTNMWGDPPTLMWTGTYAEMEYIGSFQVAATEAGANLTLPFTATGDSIYLEYRSSGPGAMWAANDANLMWATDDATAMWQIPDFAPWPGSIIATPDTYDIRLRTGFGVTPGTISALQAVLDVPDIVERCNNVSISAGGTRLPITKTYRVIRNVSLTLQAGAGTAVSTRAMDKSISGPLVNCFDASLAAVAGNVDATIQGY